MSDAPERIVLWNDWAAVPLIGSQRADYGDFLQAEYIRADIAADRIEALERNVAMWEAQVKNIDGFIEHLGAERDRYKAAIAEHLCVHKKMDLSISAADLKLWAALEDITPQDIAETKFESPPPCDRS